MSEACCSYSSCVHHEKSREVRSEIGKGSKYAYEISPCVFCNRAMKVDNFKPKFQTKPHKDETINGYHLQLFECDPYYHVIVNKGDKHIDDHLLENDHTEFDALMLRYKTMG